MKRYRLSLVLACGTGVLAVALGHYHLKAKMPPLPGEDGQATIGKISLRPDLLPDEKMTVDINETNLGRALVMYAELTGRTLLPRTNSLTEDLDDFFGRRLSRWRLIQRRPAPDAGITYHRDGRFGAQEVKSHLEGLFRTNRIIVVAEGKKHLRVTRVP